MNTNDSLTIYYDGSCSVCATEMQSYQRSNPQGRLHFIDISRSDFCAQEHGPSLEEFMARMHVRDAQGRFYLGVDAFLVIWSCYPRHSFQGWLRRIVALPFVLPLAHAGYRLFARYRHLLPKKKTCRVKTPRR